MRELEVGLALLLTVSMIPTGTAHHQESWQTATSYQEEYCSPEMPGINETNISRCRLNTTMTVQLLDDCPSNMCRVVVKTHMRFEVNYPGLLYVSMTVMVGDDVSVCIGPQVVSEALQPVVFCGRIGENYDVGTMTTLDASTELTVELAPGDRTFINGIGDACWCGAQGTWTWSGIHIARDSNGTPWVHATW